jgi:transmembrane sensor
MDVDQSQSAPVTAADWYARLRSPDCTADERAAFEAWHDLPAHATAFAAVERLARAVDRALSSRPRRYSQVIREIGRLQPDTGAAPARWSLLLPSVAAAIVLLLAAGAWISTKLGRSDTPDVAHDGVRPFAVTLAEGSVDVTGAGPAIRPPSTWSMSSARQTAHGEAGIRLVHATPGDRDG